MPEKVCQNCSEEFYVKPSHPKMGYGKYCSRECHHEGMRTGKQVECDACGKEVYKRKSKLENSESGKHFCSKSCQTIWRNRYFSGTKHTDYKHGEHIRYRSILKQSDAKMKCVMCNKEDERILTAHHIDGNRQNNDIDNLTWLCHNCHHRVHNTEKSEVRLKEKLDK